MKNFSKTWLAAWWLSVASLFLLTACGGDDEDRALAATFTANLTGAQEVPPTPSTATGSGDATVNRDTRVLTANVTTTGIAGNAAHIHEGAPGVNGPIIFPLTETAAGSGEWTTTVTLTEAQLATLRAGNYYFNVHSADFPNGEIRGQIEAERNFTIGTTTTLAGGTTTRLATTTTASSIVTTTSIIGGVTSTMARLVTTTTTIPLATATTTSFFTTSTVPGVTTSTGITTTTIAGITTTTG